MLLPISLTTSILLKQQFLICCRMRLASCLEVQIRALQIRWLRTTPAALTPYLLVCIATMAAKPTTKTTTLQQNTTMPTSTAVAAMRMITVTANININTQLTLISNI